MVKFFCDGCGDEISDRNSPRGGFNVSDRLGIEIEKNGRRLKCELLTSLNGTSNDGLFCKYCIIDAFKGLDDRPQAAPDPVCRLYHAREKRASSETK